MYSVDVVLPTARFAFSVEDGRVDVLPEHRSPEAYRRYKELKAERRVVGMTTFPNSVLLRGERTIVVDPGLHLQNQPILRGLSARGVSVADVDLVALTHAHLDHAGACADIVAPVTVHERELREAHWPAVGGILSLRPITELRGDDGELAPGIAWVRTPGHSEGSVCYLVETADGLVVLAGDTIGPLREEFDELRPEADSPEEAERLLAAWRLILSWRPTLIVPGHMPPFRPSPSRGA